MSIAYREMRHSKLPTHRAQSQAQFQTLCDALCELEGAFWSASTTSHMGKKLLGEIDRVLITVSSSDSMKPRRHVSSSAIDDLNTRHVTPISGMLLPEGNV